MSDIEDLVEGLIHMGVLATTYKIGQDAQRAFAEATEKNDAWGMLFSAIACGGAMYGFQWSAKNLNRLIGRRRALPVYELLLKESGKTPLWYLPK